MNLGAHFIPSKTEPNITSFCEVSVWYNSFYKTLNIALQAGGEEELCNFQVNLQKKQ